MINIVESACFSFSKSKDKINQDSMLEPKKIAGGVILAVADGVGSYKGAEFASQSAIEHLNSLKDKNTILDYSELFSDVLKSIKKLAIENIDHERASTTLSYCFIDEYGVHIGHIGDCRVYVKQGMKLKQLTKDHTKHQQFLDEKLFTKSQLKNIKGKNVITTAISQVVPMIPDNYFISIDELELDNGLLSLYIMSDGAHSYWEKSPRFSSNTMDSIIKMGASIQRRIERKGAVDDYTFVGCKVQF